MDLAAPDSQGILAGLRRNCAGIIINIPLFRRGILTHINARKARSGYPALVACNRKGRAILMRGPAGRPSRHERRSALRPIHSF